MNSEEKLSKLLEQDAAASSACGRNNWKPFLNATAIYRRKGWGWTQIWRRMAELGAVDKEDARGFHAWRASMSRRLDTRSVNLTRTATQVVDKKALTAPAQGASKPRTATLMADGGEPDLKRCYAAGSSKVTGGGKERTNNPHLPGTKPYTAWDNGWLEGEEEAK